MTIELSNMSYCELLQYTQDLEQDLETTKRVLTVAGKSKTDQIIKLMQQRTKLSSALYFYHKAEQGNPKVLSQDGGRVATETLREVFGQQFAGEFL